MNVSLTRELEQFIDAKVATGRYGSASEVVREGLRLLEERDELAELRREKLRQEIQVGLDQLARGETVDGEAFFAELMRKADARAEKRNK